MSQERLLSVLRAPHISEKATNNAEKSNTVVLKVALDANKAEIAAAVALEKSLCNFSRRPKLGLRGQCRVIGGN